MKRMLLTGAAACCFTMLFAQGKKTTAYAITGLNKGSSGWTEVRMVDIGTGDELQSIYKSSQQSEAFNARTGKLIEKKTQAIQVNQTESPVVQVIKKDKDGKDVVLYKRTHQVSREVNADLPFATNSAALAFDKKHNRLYYTPMGIAQLRYIDLKTGKIYYFEEESFGALKSRHDIPKQITRMVIASDGNGYALTNDANHLIQFTTGRKPKITDLGALSDDPANGAFSVHHRGGYGGDMVADAKKNLYLITANRQVFKISLETKVATFLGTIRGLPRGFTTNGAAVEDETRVVVTSSTLTDGYFHFDMNTLQAEKVSSAASVYNASDLANGNLLFSKKKKDKTPREASPVVNNPVKENNPPAVASREKETIREEVINHNIAVYPNPVTNGQTIKVSFTEQPEGRYAIQLLDIAGRVVRQQQAQVMNKLQVVDFTLPELITSGNYLIRVMNDTNEITSTTKLVVR